MTTADVKKRLRSVRYVGLRIKTLEERKERDLLRVTNITQSYENVTGIHASGGHGDMMAAYVTSIDQINEEIAELKDSQVKAAGMIRHVTSHRAATVAEMYYIDCMTWKEIASAISHSERRVYELHGVALQEIAAYYTDTEDPQ